MKTKKEESLSSSEIIDRRRRDIRQLQGNAVIRLDYDYKSLRMDGEERPSREANCRLP